MNDEQLVGLDDDDHLEFDTLVVGGRRRASGDATADPLSMAIEKSPLVAI